MKWVLQSRMMLRLQKLCQAYQLNTKPSNRLGTACLKLIKQWKDYYQDFVKKISFNRGRRNLQMKPKIHQKLSCPRKEKVDKRNSQQKRTNLLAKLAIQKLTLKPIVGKIKSVKFAIKRATKQNHAGRKLPAKFAGTLVIHRNSADHRKERKLQETQQHSWDLKL